MPNTLEYRRPAATLAIALIILLLNINSSDAQFYDLEVKVGDTMAFSGQQNVVISVYMRNYLDTVSAFNMWLLLEHPNICEFQTDSITIHDTTYWRCTAWSGPDCVDSLDITDSVIIDPEYPYDMMHVNIYITDIGNVDVSGTLIENWEHVESRVIGTPYNLKISASADLPAPPFTPGIPPQWSDVPLVKMLVDVYDIPDTTTDRDVIFYLQGGCFSDPSGECIGQDNGYDTIMDTSWFNCISWNEDSTECLLWEQVPNGPADSFWCCDTVIIMSEPDSVNFEHGTLTILGGPCRDGDVNGDGNVDLLDITYFLWCLYIVPYPPPCDLSRGDVNCSGSVNLLDITYLIAYLYKGGPPPCCN